MNPVRAALRYPQITLAITLMLVAAGVYALLRMPRREDPKIHVPVGIVAALYPGASATEIENQVTQKVEQRLFRTEGVRRELAARGFVRIRHFGFLASRRRGALLPLCKQVLARASSTTHSVAVRSNRRNEPSKLWRCPRCGGSVILVERLTAIQIRLRSPPAVVIA